MINWIKIDINFKKADRPSFFTGSMLRGVIGHALKKVTCINPSFECTDCFATNDCLYYKFYEEKNSFHNYRLGITLQPELYDFSFYLFEDEISSLPYVLSAIKKAFEEIGIGKERKKLKIINISIFDRCVYDGNRFLSLENVKTKSLALDTFKEDVEIEFTMPIRIKQNNTFATQEIALHTMINSIHMRLQKIKKNPQSSLNYRVHGEVYDSRMKFVDTQRYSGRQKSKMNMGGLKGTMKIKGLDKQSYTYLKIGEIIGAGKQTVFGLGSYIIREER